MCFARREAAENKSEGHAFEKPHHAFHSRPLMLLVRIELDLNGVYFPP
jgi:hypothetical protein